jgi:hypothetical protein
MDFRVFTHVREKWIRPMQVRLDAIFAQNELKLRSISNMALGAPVLATGTAGATIKTTNAISFINQWLLKVKAAADNIAIAAGTVVPISSFCKFLVCLQANGTVTFTQGNIAATAGAALLPAVPQNETPLGYFQIATNGATTYTPGTTLNSAAGITATYVDLVWPDSGTQAQAAAGSAALGELPTP